MARQFEDLRIWQEARQLVSVSFDLVELEPTRNLWAFKNQFLSAAVSVMNNIAEGFERGSDRQFVQFLRIAKGSAGEVRSMLYVMRDREWISTDDFHERRNEVINLASGIQALIQYLQPRSFSGTSPSDVLRDAPEETSSDLPEAFFHLEEIN